MGKAIKTRYRPMYGGNAGITEHSDGAVPPVAAWAGGIRRVECNSEEVAHGMRKLSAKIVARIAAFIIVLAAIGLLLNWAGLLIGGLLYILS